MFRLLRPLLSLPNNQFNKFNQLKYLKKNNKLSNKIYTETYEWMTQDTTVAILSHICVLSQARALAQDEK